MTDDLQQDRTDRARAALANGELKVIPVAGGGWIAVNGDGKQYFIPPGMDDCNCPDHQQRGKRMGFRCKHIEAIRMLFDTPQSQAKAKEKNIMQETQENGWMKLWHPRAVQVTIPVTPGDPVAMINTVSAYLDAGWMTDAPGLDEGELIEEISAIAKREAKDGTVIIDFYSTNQKLTKKFLHAYMNSLEDSVAFEAATGMRISDLPLYEGNIAIALDDNKAGKYVKHLPCPIKLVFKINTKWTEWKAGDGQGQEPHKRLLVRYEASANGKPVTRPLAQSVPAASLSEDARAVIVVCGSDAVNGKSLGWLIDNNRTVVEWFAGPSYSPKDTNGETVKQAAKTLISLAS